MNPKKTLILAAVLVASILYLTKVALPAKDQEKNKEMAFVDFNAQRIERIDVVKESPPAPAEHFSLTNTAPKADVPADQTKAEEGEDKPPPPADLTSWKLDKPTEVGVDDSLTQGFFSSLKDLKVGTAIDSSTLDRDFSVYGLDKPPLTLVVHELGKGPIELAFGKKNEYLSQRYVKVSGRPDIFMVDESVFTSLNKSASDLRDKKPIKIFDQDVASFTVKTAAGQFKLTQSAPGEWQIVEPISKPAVTIKVAELLRALKDLHVAEFLDGKKHDDPLYGLGKPAAAVSIAFKEGHKPERMNVDVGVVPSADGKPESTTVYFTFSDAPSVYKTTWNPITKLSITPDDLREKKLVNVDLEDVSKIKLERPGSPALELAYDKEWSVNGKPGDRTFVEQVVRNIVNLEAAEFPMNSAAAGFDQPQLTITVTPKAAGKSPIVVTFGKAGTLKNGAGVFARVGEAGESVLVKETDFKQVNAREESLLVVATPTASATNPAVEGAAGDKH